MTERTGIKTEVAASRGGIVRRERRVLAGEGMLECVNSFSLTSGKRYTKGKTRVAPDHQVANAFPSYFAPAMSDDTDSEVVAWRSRHGLDQTHQRSTRPSGETPDWYIR
jgi:hypothetical protein